MKKDYFCNERIVIVHNTVGKMSSNTDAVVTQANETHINREKYEFTWVVKNFNFELSLPSRKRFISTQFKTDYGLIELNFYPGGFDHESPYMDFEIQAQVLSGKTVRFIIWLVDKNGKEHFYYEHSNIVDRTYKTCEFVERSKINSDFLPDNCLTIKLRLNIPTYLNQERRENIPILARNDMEPLEGEHIIDEFDNFENLIINSRSSDIKIIVENQTFLAHKRILAARSDYFGAMLQSNVKEVQKGEIHITNVSAKIMKEILRFIYRGEIITDEETVKISDLLIAADMYEMDRLIEVNVELVARNLNTGNIGTILILIDRLNNNEKLKEFAIAFLTKNAKVLLNNESFQKELNSLSSSLMDEIITIMMSKM